MKSIHLAGGSRDECHRVLEAIAQEAMGLSSIED